MRERRPNGARVMCNGSLLAGILSSNSVSIVTPKVMACQYKGYYLCVVTVTTLVVGGPHGAGLEQMTFRKSPKLDDCSRGQSVLPPTRRKTAPIQRRVSPRLSGVSAATLSPEPLHHRAACRVPFSNHERPLSRTALSYQLFAREQRRYRDQSHNTHCKKGFWPGTPPVHRISIAAEA